jgi:general stress protein YciG
MEESKPKRPRGFAAMSEEKRRELGRRGGKKAHAIGKANKFTSETAKAAALIVRDRGTAHSFTSEEARVAGRKGGRIAQEDQIGTDPQ